MDPQTMALSEFTAENVEKVILGSSVWFKIASKRVQEKCTGEFSKVPNSQ